MVGSGNFAMKTPGDSELLIPAGLTRRRLLKSATGMAAAATLMPPNVRRVLAQQQPGLSSFRDIKHVVILMQENRSFDHYFGTLAGVRGFDDPEALKLSGGRPVFYQPDAENPAGYMLPFHLDTHATSAQKIPSTSHAWAVQHEAWNGGKDGSVAASPSQGGWRERPIRDGVLHSGGYSLSVRAGGIVHYLRLLPLFPYGPDLAEPHVSDDGHDRSRMGLNGGPIISNKVPPADTRGPLIPNGWRKPASVGKSTSSRTATVATC
jgi:hypothetical protein